MSKLCAVTITLGALYAAHLVDVFFPVDEKAAAEAHAEACEELQHEEFLRRVDKECRESARRALEEERRAEYEAQWSRP